MALSGNLIRERCVYVYTVCVCLYASLPDAALAVISSHCASSPHYPTLLLQSLSKYGFLNVVEVMMVSGYEAEYTFVSAYFVLVF